MAAWSYTIMGSTEADIYYFRIFSFIQSKLSKEDRKHSRIPDSIINVYVETNYDDLVKLIFDQKSRLAYQVFGVFLMKHGAKMTDKVKEFILNNSRWEDEKDQLLEPKNNTKRLHYLNDFREKIENYVEGVKTTVPFESPDDVVQQLRKQGIITTNYPFIVAPERAPIDHLIKD